MKVRHKRYGQVINKHWGNVVRIIDNEQDNYSGRIINLNENESTSTHFHSKKHKTFYVLSGTLTIEIIEPENGELILFNIDSEECFEIEQNVAHRLMAKNGGVTAIEVGNFHSDDDGHSRENIDDSIRKISMSCLLTDSSEFEGGNFQLQTSAKPYDIKLEKGDIILFPSYKLHRVSSVTKGTRHSLVAWAHGRAFV